MKKCSCINSLPFCESTCVPSRTGGGESCHAKDNDETRGWHLAKRKYLNAIILQRNSFDWKVVFAISWFPKFQNCSKFCLIRNFDKKLINFINK